MGRKKMILSWDEIDREISSYALKLRKEGYQKYHNKSIKPKLEDRGAGIYRILRAYAINGEKLNHGKLADLADLDRKRLRPYTTSLIKKGLIKRENGPHGRYYVTNMTFEDQLLKARLFSDNFTKKILGQERTLTTLKEGKLNVLELALSEFSNRIGAFITYALIHAMSIHNGNDGLQDPKLIDIIVKRWIDVAITNIIPHLVYQYRDFLNKSLDRYFDENPSSIKTWKCLECDSIGESINENIYPLECHQKESGHTKAEWTESQSIYLPRKQGENINKFIFDEEITHKLQKAFAAVYPLIDIEFKKVFENLPNEIESFKNFLNTTFSKLKQQESCNHMYDKPGITLQGHYRKQCIKCHKSKKVRQALSKR